MLALSEQFIRIGLSTLLGAVVGIEREISHKPAGLRTHILVCLGTTLATIVSVGYFADDPARMAAAIFTGVGFLGAGTIIGAQDKVMGLTTAASIWATAAVGICIGVGMYVLGIIVALLILFVLILGNIEHTPKRSRRRK